MEATINADSIQGLAGKGNRAAFTGEYWDNHKKGTYVCAACQLPLFDSKTKFESGHWMAKFLQPIEESSVLTL